MLLEELYTELLKKMDERERFIVYAGLGNLMERYRKTRDEKLTDEFEKRFKHTLIAKGLWECEKFITYPPSETINNSIKNSYSRLNYFCDCIKRYQGNNTLRMKEQDIKHIEDYFRRNYSLDAITRQDVEKVCKILGKKTAKRNEKALLRRLNPDALDDISHLEEDIIDDFKTFSNEYDILVRNELSRKKFICSQFVLFHLLRRRGHDCNLEDFVMIKTKDRKRTHSEICSIIFERLGWEFEDI